MFVFYEFKSRIYERRKLCYDKEKGGTSVRLKFQKGDCIAVAAVLLLALAVALPFFTARDEGATVQIYRDGELIQTMPLSRDATYTVEGAYTNVITVHDGAVSVTFADCPGEDCVHTGSIHAVGRSIVCLPNRVEIRIVGADADVDHVVG